MPVTFRSQILALGPERLQHTAGGCGSYGRLKMKRPWHRSVRVIPPIIQENSKARINRGGSRGNHNPCGQALYVCVAIRDENPVSTDELGERLID